MEALLQRQREVLLNAPVVAGGAFDPQYYTTRTTTFYFVVGAMTAAAVLGASWHVTSS